MKSLLTLLSLFFAFMGKAQTTDLIKYDLKSGLPGLQVTCLFEDSKGYLWVGTKSGLSRFDGIRFENFTVRDGLPANYINDILEYGGDIWALTNKGLVLFENNSFTNYPIALKDGEFLEYQVIKHTSNAFIIHVVNHSTGSTRTLSFGLANKVYKPFEVAPDITMLIGKVSENRYMAEVVFPDKGCNRKYVFYNVDTQKQEEIGYNNLRSINGSTLIISFPNDNCQKTIDKTHTFYYYQEGQLVKIYTTDIGEKDGLGSVFSVENDSTLIWISAKDHYLHRYHLKSGLETRLYLGGNLQATALIKNKAGNVWMGTEAGLYKLPPTPFQAFDNTHGLPKVNVWSFIQLGNEQFVATYRDGLLYKKSNKDNFQNVNSIKGYPDDDLFFYYGGKISPWGQAVFAHNHNGLLYQEGHFKILSPPADYSDNCWLASYIDEEREQILGFGTEGIDFFDKKGDFIERLPKSRLYEKNTFDVERLSEEVYFIALGSGQAIYNRKKDTIERLFIPQQITGLPDSTTGTMTLAKDYQGTIWMGAFKGAFGLVIYRNGHFQKVASHILDGMIETVAVVNEGRILLASRSDGGLLAIHLERFYTYLEASDKSSVANPFYFFDKSNGFLHGQEPQQNSLVPHGANRVMFTTGEGKAYFFDIDTAVFDLPKLQSHILQAEVFGEENKKWEEFLTQDYPQSGDTLHFEQNMRDIRLSFHALSHNAPEQLRYAYRMKYGKVWGNWAITEGNKVNFPLSSGFQEIEVKAYYQFQTSEMQAQVSKFVLYVAPYWHETWWGWSLVAVLLVLFGYTVYRVTKKRAERTAQAQLKVERLESENRLNLFKYQQVAIDKQKTQEYASSLEKKNKELEGLSKELSQKNAELNNEQEEKRAAQEHMAEMVAKISFFEKDQALSFQSQAIISALEERYKQPIDVRDKELMRLIGQLGDQRTELVRFIEDGIANGGVSWTIPENIERFLMLAQASNPSLIKRIRAEEERIGSAFTHAQIKAFLTCYLLQNRTLRERNIFAGHTQDSRAYTLTLERFCKSNGIEKGDGSSYEKAIIQWLDA